MQLNAVKFVMNTERTTPRSFRPRFLLACPSSSNLLWRLLGVIFWTDIGGKVTKRSTQFLGRLVEPFESRVGVKTKLGEGVPFSKSCKEVAYLLVVIGIRK